MTNSYGKQLRMRRLFRHGGSRLFTVPLDHSLTDGPITTRDGLNRLVESLSDGGVDCIVTHKGRARLLAPGVLRRTGLIVHLSGSTAHATDPNAKVLVGSVEEAVGLGADAVSVHINIGSPTEAAQLADLGKVAAACDRWGMPLLAMMYARGANIADPSGPQTLAHLASIAADLGADIVKMVYSGSIGTMREVVESSPLPVLVAGGSGRASVEKISEFVDEVVASEAAGLAMGRSVFHAAEPGKIAAAVAERLHVDATAAQHGAFSHAVA